MQATEFTVSKTVWRYEKADNLNDERVSATGARGLDVTCNKCGAQWHAQEARSSRAGHFETFAGAIRLRCSSCDQEGMLKLRELAVQDPW